MMLPLLLLLGGAAGLPSPPASRSAGLLYEVWHCEAANAMAQVKARGHPQLTTERVIQSDGALRLDDVFPRASGPYSSADIWNVEPAELGFYCLCTKREANDTLPECPMAERVARRHAAMITQAGFDYIVLDITNWPQINSATDVAIIRPLENLFDYWLALRAEGLPTPLIAPWALSPVAAYPDGQQTTWGWLLEHVYNNATRKALLWGRTPAGKRAFFLPDRDEFNNPAVERLVASNGGRDDVETIKMWALFGQAKYDSGTWGFFSPCTTADGEYTTSMVGADGPCNQRTSAGPASGGGDEISASGGYMVSQCSLPFASPGHMRGLTLQRTFAKVLEVGAPFLFVSSFNEHIGGRQPPAFASGYNMGLPDDPQSRSVWVDTYGAEFSRDLEPTVEGGGRVWEVAVSCVGLYKAGKTCASDGASSAPCCSADDKQIWSNVWSLRRASSDALLSNSSVEVRSLLRSAAWAEVCNSVPGSSVFCVDTTVTDNRHGPFMVYSTATAVDGARPLYRCVSAAGSKHFVSADPGCDGLGAAESVLGYASPRRGLETLRSLRRCSDGKSFTHALDAGCGPNETASPVLGFVR